MSLPSSARKSYEKVLDREVTALMHKTLLGGERDLPPAWGSQGLTFREQGMRCGLTQHEGGPCGVLAAVQAFVLRELLLDENAPPLAELPPEAAGEALIGALAHIIWSARMGRLANVVVCKRPTLPSLRESAGEFICTECKSADDVAAAVRAGIGAFMRAPGVAMLLYSLLLTRGIAMVQRDADFPASLIAPNGYCAQELVNLLLVGRAHSNVFDGEKVVGAVDGEAGSARGCAASRSRAASASSRCSSARAPTARCWWSARCSSGRSTRSSSCSPRATTRSAGSTAAAPAPTSTRRKPRARRRRGGGGRRGGLGSGSGWAAVWVAGWAAGWAAASAAASGLGRAVASGAPAKPPKAPTNQSDGPFDINFFDQMVLERDTPYTLTLRRRAADAPAKPPPTACRSRTCCSRGGPTPVDGMGRSRSSRVFLAALDPFPFASHESSHILSWYLTIRPPVRLRRTSSRPRGARGTSP